MTSYAIQAGALRTNPNSGPDGVGVQADIAYTLEARAEVQAVYGTPSPDNDNRPIAVSSNGAGSLRFLSVCSGIEAASVAWPQWQAVAFSEIEKFPSAVLAHHYPDVPNLGDFTKIDTSQLGRVDILCGGTPCQAFSVAGLRGGLDDARGNLTLKFVELAHALAGLGKTAGNGLRNVVWENVVGVLSDKGNAFGCFLGGLVGADAAIEPPTRGKWGNAGLVAGPKGRAAWRVCDSQYWGVAQRRRRVIVVADFGNGADPAEVLFECEGVQRHTPPRREKGEGFAGAAKGGVGGGGGLGTDFDLDGGLVYAPEIARCDATREGSSQDYETTTMVAQTIAFDLVQITSKTNRSRAENGLPAPTMLKASNMHIAQNVAIRGREGGATAELGGEVATALRASQGGGDKPHVLVGDACLTPWDSQQKRVYDGSAELAPTLSGSDGGGGRYPPAYQVHSAVRRLTPVECERLMGFPDNYTAIPWRGKPAGQCPDGPRYKALGNSWAVPLFAWLGRRIDAHMPRTAAADNDNNQEASIARAA